ncbi:MAG: nuclear transport factor 2 family protein [Rubricoccaceae bacterium]|nr:nuclear transport factor 2 family protein [Rubricoccaceae bacterium]
MRCSLLLALLSLALAAPADAQVRTAFDPISFAPCDPLYDVTLYAAHACDGGPSDAQPRTDAPQARTPASNDPEANRALVRQAYADFAAGDLPAFLAILDPHVTWTDAEGYPYAGTYVGPDALVQGLIARIGAEWDDYAVVPNAFVADGDRVVVLGDYSGTYKATGRSVEVPFAHVWQLTDGKVVRFRQFTDGPPWQRAIAP